MRAGIVAAALGAVLALGSSAQAAPRHHMRTVVLRSPAPAPLLRQDPYWVPDFISVPRYRYRPEDDRVDTSPYAPPVAWGDVEPGGTGIGQ